MIIQDQSLVAYEAGIAGIDAFKGGKTGSPNLDCPAAQHDLSVKSQEYTGLTGSGHGEGGTQIVRSVGKNIGKGELGAGKHHRQVDTRQHIRHSGGGIGHGVSTVRNYDTVESGSAFKNIPGQLLPFFRADIGGIQTHYIPHSNIIVSTKLV